ncbi:MAG: exo-alpha-sialidase [Acidobacteria bacterium]|nr:exo-alpha-sialidase [Acidobacteriota bacterium]
MLVGLSRRALLATLSPAAHSANVPARHVVVYRVQGRFGGWPANHGIWSWGNEILCGFSAAWFKRMPADRHQYDNTKPEEPRLARSLDGGETWSIESPPGLLPPEQGGLAVQPLREPMDFLAPGFAMTLRFSGIHEGPSRLFHTTDRGKKWLGPFEFPLFNRKGIAARTDYIVLGKREALAFVTASKENGREGRPLCVRTADGGLSWAIQGWIGPEPELFSIMPSSVKLSGSRILTALRVKKDQATDWIELWESSDLGRNWRFLTKPVAFTGGMSGNPPSLLRLKDRRLCLTYGYRGKPYGIRAVLSEDEGRTWSPDIILRDDGAAWDIGYTRTVQRPDGRLVTVYYFPEEVSSERIIAATIWSPDKQP